MKLEVFLRDASLRIIAFLVMLFVLWSAVLLVGVSFNWPFLTNKIEQAFYLGGFIAVLLIIALSLTNMTASLTIISKNQNKEPGETIGFKKQLTVMALISGIIVCLVLGGLWFAEWQVYQRLSEEAVGKVLTISEKAQFATLAKTIKADGTVQQVLELRDALAADIGSEGKVSFLIPKTRAGVKIYYEIVPWLQHLADKKISETDLNPFKPNRREQADFDKLSLGKIDTFKVPLDGNHLRVFKAVSLDNQEIVILLDTSRQANDSRGSFK